MADGKIEIDIEVKDSKAQSQGKRAGEQIAKAVESGLKNVGKSADAAAKETENSFKNAANSAKSSFSDVGSAAKSSFGDVGDAAKTASGDAASAFQDIPADASGSFSDVGSEAQSGFGDVADAANSASGDAASAFQNIPADASGSFSDVSSSASSGFSGVADAANSAAGDAASAFQQMPPAASAAADGVYDALGVKVVAAGNLIADAFETAAGKMVEVGGEAVNTGMAFDSGMSQVAATMGKTTDEIQDLRDFAKEMGESTAFSATQASEALNYMALAGYDSATSMRVLPTVLNLAAAGNMDLARASDMVTDAQSALGLSVEEAEVMVDQMAMTSSKTNTSVEQLGDAFLTVGGTAKNLQGGTQELAQMLGILADNGVKGSEGGTALRNVILSLSAPTDKAAEAIEGLGLQVFDAEGNMRSMPDIFHDLNSAMEPLTQEERTQLLNNIFNKVDLKSVNALLGTSSERFDEVATAIDGAQGSAQKMAETQLDNLEGDVTLLQSATEGLFIAISDELSPILRDLAKWATNTLIPFLKNKALPTVVDLVKNFDKWAPYITAVIVAIAGFKTSQKIIKAFGTETSFVGKSVKAMGLEFQTASTKAKLAAVATNGLKIALKGLQTVGILALFTAATEGITLFVNVLKDAKERSDKMTAATTGLSDAASGVTVKINEETGALEEFADTADDLNVDELVQKHVDLANSLSDIQQSAADGQAELAEYRDIIDKLAGRSDLSAEEVAKLELAVEGVNDACGTSYDVVGGNGEAYRIMADGAEVAKDAIFDVIDAQMRQIQAEADLEGYRKVYAQAQEDAEKLAEAKAKVAEQQEKFNEIEDMYEGRVANTKYTVDELKAAYDSEKAQLEKLKGELSDVEAVTGSADDATRKYTERLTLNRMAAEVGASALTKAAASNLEYRTGVQAAGVDLVAFSQSLEAMGFTSDQVAHMTQEDAIQLARAWENGYDDMKAATEEVVGEVPAALKTMGEKGFDAAKEAGAKAPVAYSSSFMEQLPDMEKALNQLSGINSSTFESLISSAGITGEKEVSALAIALSRNSKLAEASSEEIAQAVNDALAEIDGEDPAAKAIEIMQATFEEGQEPVQESGEAVAESYAEGIEEGQDSVEDAAETVSDAAETEFTSLWKRANDAGAKSSSEYASGISSGTTKSQSSALQNALAAMRGLASQDGSKPGKELSGDFSGAVASSEDTAKTNAGIMADAVQKGFKRDAIIAHLWGEELGASFANGIRESEWKVKAAAKAIADAAKSILGHSVPKAGPLREGGKGEALWGQHLVQNFADGMLNSQSRSAIRNATREMAIDINDSLMRELQGIDPMGQLEESISKGSAAFQMSAMMVGAAPTYTTNNQTLNFNGEINSPDIIARNMRMQQFYGLAGRY